MSISSIFSRSQPAEFNVVGMATCPSPSADKSCRKRRNPWPPVMTETPET